MKFRAKVKISSEKKAEDLLKAFFEEFNRKSSINVGETEATVEIDFTEPPKRIIDAICKYDVIEFEYNNSDQTSEDSFEVVKDEEEICTSIPASTEETLEKEDHSKENELDASEKNSSDTTDEIEVTEISEVNNEEEPKDDNIEVPNQVVESHNPEVNAKEVTKKSKTSKHVIKYDNYNIPELDELANKSSSYQNFVNAVTEWLELKNKDEFFKCVIDAAEDANKVSWNEIEKVLKSKNIFYSSWDKIFCTKQVAARFENSDDKVTILKLIKAILEFRAFKFDTKSNTETASTVKMQCMPSIPSFEEVLGRLDKSKPVNDRILYVLSAMGLKDKDSHDQKAILKIATAAVQSANLDFDSIFSKTDFSEVDALDARMTFSEFINDFAKSYGSDKNIKLITFLEELKNIVND